jgi:hypothetical protein
MAFSTLDDLISEIGASKFQRSTGFRTINTGATSVAGRWHECMSGTGSGGVMTLTGTAGVGVALSSSTSGAFPQQTVNVSTDTKHLLTMSGVTPATTAVPGFLVLTDLLYMYTSCVLTGTPTTLNNGAAKPTRFNNGVGVQASAIVATAVGAATPSLTMTYTDSGGTGSNTGNLTASANSLPVGSCFTGGTVATLGSLYMNLANGDSGVRQLDSYTIPSGPTTGTVTFMLHRPIATIPLVAANVAGERDFLFNMPSLPKIDDDACLGFFLLTGGALTASNQVQVDLGMAWG